MKLICERMNMDIEDAVEISDDRPGKDAAYLLDSGTARDKLGWNDRISLEQGIDDTIKWIEDNLEILSDIPMVYIHKP